MTESIGASGLTTAEIRYIGTKYSVRYKWNYHSEPSTAVASRKQHCPSLATSCPVFLLCILPKYSTVCGIKPLHIAIHTPQWQRSRILRVSSLLEIAVFSRVLGRTEHVAAGRSSIICTTCTHVGHPSPLDFCFGFGDCSCSCSCSCSCWCCASLGQSF